jgi:hypothetical protein
VDLSLNENTLQWATATSDEISLSWAGEEWYLCVEILDNIDGFCNSINPNESTYGVTPDFRDADTLSARVVLGEGPDAEMDGGALACQNCTGIFIGNTGSVTLTHTKNCTDDGSGVDYGLFTISISKVTLLESDSRAQRYIYEASDRDINVDSSHYY